MRVGPAKDRPCDRDKIAPGSSAKTQLIHTVLFLEVEPWQEGLEQTKKAKEYPSESYLKSDTSETQVERKRQILEHNLYHSYVCW